MPTKSAPYIPGFSKRVLWNASFHDIYDYLGKKKTEGVGRSMFKKSEETIN